MAETLASRAPATVLWFEYSLLVGWERTAGCGWCLVLNTLLGPEETSTPRLCWGCLRLLVPDPDRVETSPCGLGRRAGSGAGRCLRIAQWTRASLWSSCRGRTVNALAPGADEGRGRPR